MRGRIPAEDWQVTAAAATAFPSAPKTIPLMTVVDMLVVLCALDPGAAEHNRKRGNRKPAEHLIQCHLPVTHSF